MDFDENGVAWWSSGRVSRPGQPSWGGWGGRKKTNSGTHTHTHIVSNASILLTGFSCYRQSQQSFNTSTLPFLFFLLTHYMFRPLRAILRWDIQLDVSKDYSYYNGSVVRTQLDVCLYWYFDPWSPFYFFKMKPPQETGIVVLLW
jgi:hypothetical protein